MSQQGIRGFYQLTETIETQLLADVNVNTVTTGDIFDIDLAKNTLFPLMHINTSFSLIVLESIEKFDTLRSSPIRLPPI